MLRPLLASLLMVCVPGIAGAVTLRVPADHATIQDAVDAAASSDVIQVSNGSYGPFTVDGKTGLTIRGAGKPSVDGGGAAISVVTISDSTGIILDGLVIENSGGRGVLITDSTNVTVRRCTVQDTASDGIRAWGARVSSSRRTPSTTPATASTSRTRPPRGPPATP